MPTTSRGAPYPGPGDANNVPVDLHALAQWMTDQLDALEADMAQAESGMHTPTVSATTNVAGWSVITAAYMRVEDVITVSGQVSITPTTTGPVAFTLDLPAGITGITGAMLHGVGAYRDVTTGVTGAVHASKGAGDNAQFRFVTADINQLDIRYTFTLRVTP